MVPLAVRFRADVESLRGMPLVGGETEDRPSNQRVAQDAHLDALGGQVVNDSACKRRRRSYRVFSTKEMIFLIDVFVRSRIWWLLVIFGF